MQRHARATLRSHSDRLIVLVAERSRTGPAVIGRHKQAGHDHHAQRDEAVTNSTSAARRIESPGAEDVRGRRRSRTRPSSATGRRPPRPRRYEHGEGGAFNCAAPPSARGRRRRHRLGAIPLAGRGGGRAATIGQHRGQRGGDGRRLVSNPSAPADVPVPGELVATGTPPSFDSTLQIPRAATSAQRHRRGRCISTDCRGSCRCAGRGQLLDQPAAPTPIALPG